MKRQIQYSTLVELMILTPLFTFGIYVAIYFGECVLTKINGAVAARYVADTPSIVTVDTLKTNFVTERGQSSDLSGHYWVGNGTIAIAKQEKAHGRWPVSETGSSDKVIHDYLTEYSFDVNVSYVMVDNNLERRVSFTHPQGGLDLMRYFVSSEADDVIQNLLQERITYSDVRLEYNYINTSPVPSAFDEMKDGTIKTSRDVSLSTESRSMVLLEDTPSRNFYKEMSSINRLTSGGYDNGEAPLTDGRMSQGSRLESDGGGTDLSLGSGSISWSSNSEYETVRDVYPLNGNLSSVLTIDEDAERAIQIEEMEDAYLDMAPDAAAMVTNKDCYVGLGL